jgi:uncharacterized iron-regulated protein
LYVYNTDLTMPKHRIIQIVLTLMLARFLLGCTAPPIKPAPTVTIKGVPASFRIGDIIDLHRGEVIPFDRMIQRIAPMDLIFVGEDHDNPEHHLIQVQIFQALLECCAPVNLAMEAFQSPQQAVVDRYLRGEFKEMEFLEKAAWQDHWGYRYHLYRPLLVMARKARSRVLAVNAPNEIVKKVSKNGLENLDPSERARIAKEIRLDNKRHRRYLQQVYQMHDHGNIPAFDRFYEAQCVWEDTMAENVARYFREQGRHRARLLVIAGNGHIRYKYGVPERTIRRIPVAMVTIVPYPVGEKTTIDSGIADYVWLTTHHSNTLKRNRQSIVQNRDMEP